MSSALGPPANPRKEMDPQNILGYGIEMREFVLFSLSCENWFYIRGLCHICCYELTARLDPSFGYKQKQTAVLCPGLGSSSHECLRKLETKKKLVSSVIPSARLAMAQSSGILVKMQILRSLTWTF